MKNKKNKIQTYQAKNVSVEYRDSYYFTTSTTHDVGISYIEIEGEADNA